METSNVFMRRENNPEKLFYSHRDKVYGFFLKFVRNKEIAKDLTQDVFVKLLEKKERLATIEDLDGYIYRISKNMVLDHLKKLASCEKYNQSVRISNVILPTVEVELDNEYYESVLEKNIKRLPNQQQVVFNLSKKQGLAHKEIAKKLNISVNTVRNHLHQAMKKLKANSQLINTKTV